VFYLVVAQALGALRCSGNHVRIVPMGQKGMIPKVRAQKLDTFQIAPPQ
jgi:hypothetical protein